MGPAPQVLNGRYRLDSLIGRGSFAQVFACTDLWLQRPVAVKLLNPDRSVFGEAEDFLSRFMHEARLIARLDHPHILAVYDYGQVDSSAYLIMPLVEGGTLHDRLRGHQQLRLEDTSAYLWQAAGAIDYAHRRNLVHCDIKLQNLLVRAEDDHLFLADFGIATLLSGTGGAAAARVRGTLHYMAPEQLQGTVSHATDIYALGCVLFELLSGHPPLHRAIRTGDSGAPDRGRAAAARAGPAPLSSGRPGGHRARAGEAAGGVPHRHRAGGSLQRGARRARAAGGRVRPGGQRSGIIPPAPDDHPGRAQPDRRARAGA